MAIFNIVFSCGCEVSSHGCVGFGDLCTDGTTAGMLLA